MPSIPTEQRSNFGLSSADDGDIAEARIAERRRNQCGRLEVEAAASYLGCSSSFLNKRRLSGDGPPYFKIGSRVQYSIADLDTWIASRRRTSTSASCAPAAA